MQRIPIKLEFLYSIYLSLIYLTAFASLDYSTSVRAFFCASNENIFTLPDKSPIAAKELS